MPEPVAGPVRLAYMQLVRLVRNGRRPTAAVRRTRLALLAAGLLLLLIGALALPSADAGTPSHSRGISQLHRLAIEVDSASATGKDVKQAAAEQAILAALVSLAAALAVLIGARQRGRQPAGRLIPAERGRGPPSDR
jgi:hypothetical protein